jgi:hypothetical protein
VDRTARAAEGEGVGRVAADVVHVALVLAGSDLCFVAAARSPHALARRLGEYVREWAPRQLWPDDTRWVEELLRAGRVEDAVAHYFKVVGDRWDCERLVMTTAADDE